MALVHLRKMFAFALLNSGEQCAAKSTHLATKLRCFLNQGQAADTGPMGWLRPLTMPLIFNPAATALRRST